MTMTDTPIKLISVTPDAEKHMAYCARVSNPNNQENEKFSGLLKYCVKHQHWSIFEQAYMTLEINTTRGVAAQVLRHRSMTYQEFSQRYADSSLLAEAIPLPELRRQDTKNRQNSISEGVDIMMQYEWSKRQEDLIEQVKIHYNWAISNGIAKEQARALLPEGLIMSRMYMSGSLRSWIHYIQLRSGNGTQKEHMELAQECGKAISKIFPLAEDLIQGE